MEVDKESMISIREYDPKRDCDAVKAVERTCEVGPSGEVSLYTDLLGDPMCRIRHSPEFLMLVAETCGPAREIVGLIRGCIKSVTCGTRHPISSTNDPSPIYTKLGYILGLRVSPGHRRKGIALQLVNKIESWLKEKGAEYAYMATEKDNEASLRLFIARCGYHKFRTASILVQPVYAHRQPASRRVSLCRIPVADAVHLYLRKFATTEFFPRDIDAILGNQLSLGTYIAVYGSGFEWDGVYSFLGNPPKSWAVVSVWDSKALFRLEVKGVSKWNKWLAKTSRITDRLLPWLKLPSLPDLFNPFGFYLMYGLGGEGERVADLVRVLCGHVHNMARDDDGCGLVVAEVAGCEPLRIGIPHWERLSCAEDLWCVKRVAEGYGDGEVGDWTKAPPRESIFVDPREF